MYVGQYAGTPVLQVHAMVESDSQQPHFYLCWNNPQKPPTYAPWFHLDETTGILSMNKTLEWSDFDNKCELNRDRLRICILSPLFLGYFMKLTVQSIYFAYTNFQLSIEHNTPICFQYTGIFNIVKCVWGNYLSCSACTLCA